MPGTDGAIVQKGQVGRIFLKNGNSIKGTVTEVTPDSISIGKVGNYGFEETVVLAVEIDRIEVESGSATDSIMTGIVGAIAIAGGVILVAALFGAVAFGPND